MLRRLSLLLDNEQLHKFFWQELNFYRENDGNTTMSMKSMDSYRIMKGRCEVQTILKYY